MAEYRYMTHRNNFGLLWYFSLHAQYTPWLESLYFWYKLCVLWSNFCRKYLPFDGCPGIKLAVSMMWALMQEFRVPFHVAFNALHSLSTKLHPNGSRPVQWPAHLGDCFSATLTAHCMTELTLSGNFGEQDFVSDYSHVWIFNYAAWHNARPCGQLS